MTGLGFWDNDRLAQRYESRRNVCGHGTDHTPAHQLPRALPSGSLLHVGDSGATGTPDGFGWRDAELALLLVPE